MAVLKTRKFMELLHVDTFLNGGLIAGNVVGGNPAGGGTRGRYGVFDLVGKTLKFKQPSVVTVTFTAGASGGILTPAEIKTQIEAAIAAVRVSFTESKLLLQEVTPTNGVTIDKTGTGNALLGFDKVADTVGQVYSSIGGATPSLQAAYSVNNMHVVITYE